MLQKTAKRGVREWCPSTTGPLLPTMTDSLLAPGREVLYKRYHTGELVLATILGPSDDGDDFVRLASTWLGTRASTLKSVKWKSASHCALNGLGISCLGMRYRRFTTLSRATNSVSNEHYPFEPYFLWT